MLIELDERILRNVLCSLLVTNDEEGRPEYGAILILEEDRVSVIDLWHRATLRLASASDSPLLDDSLHIDPVELQSRAVLDTYTTYQRITDTHRADVKIQRSKECVETTA